MEFDTVAVYTSGKITFPRNVVATDLYVTLKTAGSSTTTVRVLKNGSLIGSAVSFGSGSTTDQAVSLSDTAFTADADELQFDITAAGTGARGLVPSVRYR